MSAGQLSARSTVVLRELRAIGHSSQHISDVTRNLSDLTALKRGAIDEVIASLAEISKALDQLQSPELQQELQHYRHLESRAAK